MSTIRRVVYFLERIGARRLLSLLATIWARRLTRLDVEIFHDDVWLIRLDDTILPRKQHFDIQRWDIENLRFRRKRYLAESLDYWTHQYRPTLGDVVIDVGAGDGVDALAFSQLVGVDGIVYALEAHPITFRRLQKTCTWNQLHNVVPVQCAIWSEKRTLWISDNEADQTNSILDQSDAHSAMVNGIDLDSFIEMHAIEEIALLKMNIEGAERAAIKGMARAVKRVKNIVIACHDFMGTEACRTRDEVVSFLQLHNFEVTRRMDDLRPYVRDHIFAKPRVGLDLGSSLRNELNDEKAVVIRAPQ